MRIPLPPAFLRIPIAHRGYHDHAIGRPENSLSAFRAAIEAGYGIELDVQLTGDGQAIVFHDDQLDRMTDATGSILAHSAAELATIRLLGTQSKEAVRVPPTHAAEMVPFNPLVGEFRVHYAGFFDPGFGHSSGHGEGARAVLEVRSHEVPFILEDGQIIGRLVYEPLTEKPDRVYGEVGSSYQKQGLKLSKHFKPFDVGKRLG